MPALSIGQVSNQFYTPRPISSATGGTLTTATVNGVNYNYHLFSSSGELIINNSGYYEIVAVGGGGGGGMDNGGGGGAGELIHAPSYFLNSGTYGITIGAGGAGAPTSSGSSTGNPASDGNDTTLGSIFTARAGGGGASGQGTVISRKGGSPGGSGGGGQGENNSLFFIYGGPGYGSLADNSVSYLFTPGLSHSITVTNNSVFDFSTSTDFTMSLWAIQFSHYTTSPTSGYIFSTQSGTTYYRLSYTANASLGVISLAFEVSTAGTLQTVVQFNQGLAYRSWNHIAITRSGSTYRLHVNGLLVDEQTVADVAVNSGGGNLLVGNSWEGSIKDLHFISGQALYSADNFPVPESYPSASSSTVLLMLLDPSTTEHSQYAHTISTNDTSIRPSVTSFGYGKDFGSPYSYPYSKTVLGAGYDSASGGYLRADAALSTLTSTSMPWTMECHARTEDNLTGDQYLFGINTAASGANILLIGNDRVVVGGTSVSYSTKVTSHKWQHFAATFDGVTVRVFINGVLTASRTGAPGTALSACVLGIGTEFDAANGGTPGNYWYGELRNIRIVAGTALYTEDFQAPDVTEQLTEVASTTLLTGVTGRIEDTSSAATTVTAYGNIKGSINLVLATEKKCYKFSSYYNTYFRADNALSTLTSTSDPWTVEAFVQNDLNFKRDDTTDGWIFSFNTKASGANNLLLTGGRFVYYNGTAEITAVGFKHVLPNEWCHLAYSYNGTTLRIFIDGIKVYEAAMPFSTPLADCVFGIGTEFDAANGGTPGNYWYGRMRDLRFTPGACLYKNNFNAPDPITGNLTAHPLTTLLTFRDGEPVDISGNNTTVTAYNNNNTITDCFGQYYTRRKSSVFFRYGNDGGNATAADGGGGGGGGASREGRQGAANAAGTGGDGFYIDGFSSFGEVGYFAGGGGGGNSNSGSTSVRLGGNGGGGNGGVTGTDGLANTGGGGGASRISIAGRAGGSGVVVIRYATS